MHNSTEELFCLPCDTDSRREGLPLYCMFDFIVGNLTTVPPKHSTGWRTMPFHLITIPLLDGTGAVNRTEIAGGEGFESNSGDMIFIPAGVAHRISDLRNDPPPRSLWMHFRLRVLENFDVLSFYDLPYRIPAECNGVLRQLLERLIAMPRHLDFTGTLEQQLTGLNFCAELLRFGSRRSGGSGKTDFNLRRLQPVLKRLSASVTLPPIRSLAGSVNLSPSRFLAVFRETMGMSPGQYFETGRFRRAALLLMRENCSIGEIADMLGFCSPFHFSNKFRRIAGVSPSEFRRQHAGSAGNPSA